MGHASDDHKPEKEGERSGRAADRNQAIWNAVWTKEKFGLRWVTAVLCVGTEPPEHPFQQGNAWIVGTDDLIDFLRKPRQ